MKIQVTVWQERKQARENECESIRKSKDEIERKGVWSQERG